MEVTADIFKCLYLPFHVKLYRIAFALVGNQEEAEDIVQEVYSRLWERRDELAAVRNPEAYAITLTKHFCGLSSFSTGQPSGCRAGRNGRIPV